MEFAKNRAHVSKRASVFALVTAVFGVCFCLTGVLSGQSCVRDDECPEERPWCYEGQCQEPCAAHCDCPQGFFCYRGACLVDPKMPVYCCEKSDSCPPGRWCVDAAGGRDICAETSTYRCESACDCGPAHCCKNNICVKDIDDPWFPGGTVPGEAFCEEGVDPTYCCDDPTCQAGRVAYGDHTHLFLCENPSGGAQNFCSGVICHGSACDCDPGESCVDTLVDGVPAGAACFLEFAGTCVSNAVAESLFGFASSDLVPCCWGGARTGELCDAGWQSLYWEEGGGSFGYRRVVGRAGSCGNGRCDDGEYPATCPDDCFCGDGSCAAEERENCPSDCGSCDNQLCEPWESHRDCPRDCEPCGDGWCEIDEIWSCPGDCSPCPDAPYYAAHGVVCGDRICQDPRENPDNCAHDCFCGDTVCQDGWEDASSCPADCAVSPAPANAALAAALEPVPDSFFRDIGGFVGSSASYFAPDIGRAIAIHDGQAYVTGMTQARDLEVTDDSSHGGDWDAFIARINGQGELDLLAYLDNTLGLGRSDQVGRDIVVDANGTITIAGSMGWARLDIVETEPGLTEIVPLLVEPLDAPGAMAVDLDAGGNIYVTGDMELLGIAKFLPDGEDEYQESGLATGLALDIAVDDLGQAHVTGSFGVLKVNAQGESLYHTPLSGTGNAIAVDAGGKAYIAGHAHTEGGATPGAYSETLLGPGDAFVAILDPLGNILYFTYLGGSGNDEAHGIALDRTGAVYLAGSTLSDDFPTTADALSQALKGIGDPFVARLDPAGGGLTDLTYSTYFNFLFSMEDPRREYHHMPDRAFDIALDDSCHVYFTGEANLIHAAFTQAFVTKIFVDSDGDGVLDGCAVPFVRADANGDGKVNIADPSFIANFLFGVAPATQPPCRDAADSNGDATVNIADVSFVANFLFGVSPATPPPEPGTTCGVAPLVLGCDDPPEACSGSGSLAAARAR